MPKLRLAYLSPLPPEKSGIADYSADLLPQLAQFYDIDVIAALDLVQYPISSNAYRLRSLPWFHQHADNYDRIIYHFGSAPCHQHMWELLKRFPGIVVLHDFFLGESLRHLDDAEPTAQTTSRELYASHGYQALLEDHRLGREEAIRKFPCNKSVLNTATGMIVHSHFSMQLATDWYGIAAAQSWRTIPILKSVPAEKNRIAARHQLGIASDDFVILSLGFIVPFKLNHRIIDAWLNSSLANNATCHLIFVGESNHAEYTDKLNQMITRSDNSQRIRITGFVDHSTYHAYLAAADGAIQLRSHSRGETSAAILDCLSYGIPTIINAHGSAAELPEHALVKLTDDFSQVELSEAISRLHDDADLRKSLSENAVEYIRLHHRPENIAMMYHDAIEAFSREPTQFSVKDTAISSPRQILIDIPAGAITNDGMDCRWHQAMEILLQLKPNGDRIELVYFTGKYYVYARSFTCNLLNLPAGTLEDEEANLHPADIFLQVGAPPQAPRAIDTSTNKHYPQQLHSGSTSINAFLCSVLALKSRADYGEWLQSMTVKPKRPSQISSTTVQKTARKHLNWIEEIR